MQIRLAAIVLALPILDMLLLLPLSHWWGLGLWLWLLLASSVGFYLLRQKSSTWQQLLQHPQTWRTLYYQGGRWLAGILLLWPGLLSDLLALGLLWWTRHQARTNTSQHPTRASSFIEGEYRRVDE